VIDACQRPYQNRISLFDYADKNYNERKELAGLYDNATLMQDYEAYVAPVAPQLRQLATSWAALSVKNKTIDQVAHAVARELIATLDAPPMNGCAFVRAIAEHHYSYQWARHSAFGTEITRWWKQISTAGNEVGMFWQDVQLPTHGRPAENGLPAMRGLPAGPWAGLFTAKQLATMVNLPGELG
jgi:hypothetical protein